MKRLSMKKLGLLVCLTLGFTSFAFAEGDAEAGKAKSLHVQLAMAVTAIVQLP